MSLGKKNTDGASLTRRVPGVCYFFNKCLAINSLNHLISSYTEMPLKITAVLRNCGLRLNCHVMHTSVVVCSSKCTSSNPMSLSLYKGLECFCCFSFFLAEWFPSKLNVRHMSLAELRLEPGL